MMVYDRASRAYGLAYASTTAPRLLNLLLYWYRKKSARRRVLSSVSYGHFVVRSVISRFLPEVFITFELNHQDLSIERMDFIADPFRYEDIGNSERIFGST